MTYRGHVINGAIVLDDFVVLPEGATVDVAVSAQEAAEPTEAEIPTLLERLKDFVGKVDGLPPDASVNLDHYLYGAPKRQ